jgi:hypothetical protein
MKWIKDWVYDPEEPPMFVHYECSGCGHNSGIIPTSITEDAVRKLGYDSFIDYAAQNGLLKSGPKRDDA